MPVVNSQIVNIASSDSIPETRHQLCDGPRIDPGNACTADPLQGVDVMHAHVKARARGPVEANADVPDRETATGAVNRLADLALSNGLGRLGIARVEPQDMGNEKPSTPFFSASAICLAAARLCAIGFSTRTGKPSSRR